MRSGRIGAVLRRCLSFAVFPASAEMIFGVVNDQTGAMLPGVSVELRGQGALVAYRDQWGG